MLTYKAIKGIVSYSRKQRGPLVGREPTRTLIHGSKRNLEKWKN